MKACVLWMLIVLLGTSVAQECPVQIAKVKFFDTGMSARIGRAFEHKSVLTDIRDNTEEPHPFLLSVWFTNSDREIKAIKFKVNFLDATGEVASSEEYAEDKHVLPKKNGRVGWNTKYTERDSMQAIKILKLRFDVWPTKVIFADGSEWINNGQQCAWTNFKKK